MTSIMASRKSSIRVVAAIVTCIGFACFMAALLGNNWRENSSTVLTNEALQKAIETQLNMPGYTWKSSHGLWWQCVNPPDDNFRQLTEKMVSQTTGKKLELVDGCEPIESGTDVDSNRQGNSIRASIGFACIFSITILILELGRCFCFKHNIFEFLSYLCSFMSVLCGITGMALFTKYYAPCYTMPGDWRDYGWSYFIGWSGCAIMFIPMKLYLVAMFLGERYHSDDLPVYTNAYPMK